MKRKQTGEPAKKKMVEYSNCTLDENRRGEDRKWRKKEEKRAMCLDIAF